VTQVLQATSLPPERLYLEITEPAELNQAEEILDVLRALRRLGISCSLDCFGVGASSLRFLRQFPFVSLKIDRSITSEVCASGSDDSIMSAIVLVASGLQIISIADGVERRDQADAVLSMGCKAAQGDYYGPPVPSEQVDSLVRSVAEAA
jgi:EAL domain-containing protein (putative c-di-GMP-specific phosphodiesterase class I)